MSPVRLWSQHTSMKKLIPPTVAAALAFFFVSSAPAAESPSVLLQKGIYAEETEGNLDSAIKIYEQIAAESASNRAVVAQAQYRLAMCYQRKGENGQAIRLLNEVVQQPMLDSNVNKKARETLMQLGVVPAESVSIRKVPLPFAAEWLMSISSDGRFIAYQPDGTDDIDVCEFLTGKSWTVYKGTK